MKPSSIRLLMSVLVLVLVERAVGQPLMTVQASSQGLQASDLVNEIVTGSGYTVVSGTQTMASTDLRAIGKFFNGNAQPGRSLTDRVDPNAVYAGGIGPANGVVLSTGFLRNDEPTAPPNVPPVLAVGVRGSNNGFPIDLVDVNAQDIPNHEGEVSKMLHSTAFGDADFRAVHFTLPAGGDPALLEFEIQLTSPGFLRVSFVFASDEYPAWIEEDFNDTIVILVKGACTPPGDTGENLATFVRNGVTENFSLQALRLCPALFRTNQMTPASRNVYPNSLHQISGASYYDHEFGGFSKILTRETAKPLAPGRYTIKFVIEDIQDQQVDSAIFIESGSLKLFPLAQGDYNGDGCVDDDDYGVWASNFGKSPATFYDGNGNCMVDITDYTTWRSNLGTGGNGDFRADFNRDGMVDGGDYMIWLDNAGLLECASRFEGDANGDGRVDRDDLDIWQAEIDAGGSGGCGGESATSGGGSTASLKQQLPEHADVNGDGVVDEQDFAAIGAIIAAWKEGSTPFPMTEEQPSGIDEGPAPTLAPPPEFGPADSFPSGEPMP